MAEFAAQPKLVLSCAPGSGKVPQKKLIAFDAQATLYFRMQELYFEYLVMEVQAHSNFIPLAHSASKVESSLNPEKWKLGGTPILACALLCLRYPLV